MANVFAGLSWVIRSSIPRICPETHASGSELVVAGESLARFQNYLLYAKLAS